MSDEKKPFARIERQREHNHERLHLFVAERFVASEPAGPTLGEPEALPSLAAAINTAVDQREAKLYTRLMVARQLAVSMRGPGARGPIDAIIETLGDVDVYAPTPAEVGAAFDAGMRLGLLERLHEGTWAVLCDHLMQTQGPLRPAAMGLVKELGLPAETFVPLHKRQEAVKASHTTDLLAELHLRGASLDDVRRLDEQIMAVERLRSRPEPERALADQLAQEMAQVDRSVVHGNGPEPMSAAENWRLTDVAPLPVNYGFSRYTFSWGEDHELVCESAASLDDARERLRNYLDGMPLQFLSPSFNSTSARTLIGVD